MNLQQYRLIAKALNAEIEQALAKRKLKLHKVRATVDERGGEVRLSITARDEDAGTNPDRETFKMLAELVGLKPEMLDDVFSHGGEDYRVVGMKARGEKTILLERLSDNSVRVARPSLVASGFALQKRRAS